MTRGGVDGVFYRTDEMPPGNQRTGDRREQPLDVVDVMQRERAESDVEAPLREEQDSRSDLRYSIAPSVVISPARASIRSETSMPTT